MKPGIARKSILSVLLGTALGANLLIADACTRVVYLGRDDTVITGRSMDWAEDIQSNLWIFPRGIRRTGLAPKTIEWTSRYGSVTATAYDLGSADGMNEKGLVANLLFLAESDYGREDGRPVLSISLWPQYVLDNFATVAEAVDALRADAFRIAAPPSPDGKPSTVHLSISDASGDSAIFEYVAGKLQIHHSRDYRVMTNSPTFDKQLALNEYWKSIGGTVFMPGTNRAADRFARASFLINAVPKDVDARYRSAIPGQDFTNQALLSTLSVIRSVSVPLGITTPGQPNISSTLWRSVSDHKNRIYYFDSATSPTVFWVDLKQIDFAAGKPVRKLDLQGGKIYSGHALPSFTESKPFDFMPASGQM